MQKTESLASVVIDIEETILTYYDYSFRIESEKCMVLIQKLISQLEILLTYINSEQTSIVQMLLLQAVQAMDNKDYVLLRDILYYDLRRLLVQIPVADCRY